MSELSILQALVTAGMTPVGACAMGGNIQAESGFKANIAQRGMTKLSDEEYTAKADEKCTGFYNDAIGYGLCQWTYPTRKQNLWFFAKDHETSVGNEEMQVSFIIDELKNEYHHVWNYLLTTDNIEVATGLVCTDYEIPAVNNTLTRINFAKELYNKYWANLPVPDETNGKPENGKINYNAFMPVIKRGNKSPETHYLCKLLEELGYDVLWSGLWACVVDFQQKRGLDVDGICGEQTWNALIGGKR